MDLENENFRYKSDDGVVVVEIVVKNSRQLFNERDPAPFRERDLDEQFVAYVVSSFQEFPLQTMMKIQIHIEEKDDLSTERNMIKEAIKNYFHYESKLARSRIRRRFRMARLFSLIGFITLFTCLSLAQFISSLDYNLVITNIISTGLVIIGWVAMWHPIEALLYDWWPIREQRRYFDKIATTSIDVD